MAKAYAGGEVEDEVGVGEIGIGWELGDVKEHSPFQRHISLRVRVTKTIVYDCYGLSMLNQRANLLDDRSLDLVT